MPKQPVVPYEQPQDRLTRIGGAMNDAAQAHPESREGDRYVSLLYADDGSAGVALHGYHPDKLHEALTDIFMHMRAIAAANGMSLDFVPLKEKGQG
jgi:hypothetical protein